MHLPHESTKGHSRRRRGRGRAFGLRSAGQRCGDTFLWVPNPAIVQADWDGRLHSCPCSRISSGQQLSCLSWASPALFPHPQVVHGPTQRESQHEPVLLWTRPPTQYAELFGLGEAMIPRTAPVSVAFCRFGMGVPRFALSPCLRRSTARRRADVDEHTARPTLSVCDFCHELERKS